MEEISCAEELEWEHFQKNLTESIMSVFERLGQLWSTIGIRGQLLQDRCGQVLEHYQDLAERMYQEDHGLYQRLLQTVPDSMETLKKYCQQIDLPVPQINEGPPLMMKQELEKKLEEVSSIRQSRLERLGELRALEEPLCRLLDLPAHDFVRQRPVPTQEDLDELAQHVDMLETEREQRERKYCIYRKDVERLLQVLQKPATTPLELETTATPIVPPIDLSQAKLVSLRNLIEELKREREECSRVLEELSQRLSCLWDLLQEDQNHRRVFMEENGRCTHRALQAMREEISRCEELRRANMALYIGNLRQELVGLWSKCQTSQKQKETFQPHFKDENMREELLVLHEREVQYWCTLYHNFQSLFVKAERIGELFRKALDLQHRASDPNRLNNRGGQLLQEEKERKKLLLQIPKLERELVEMSRQYETQSGTTFLVCSLPLADYLREKWGEFHQDKENEKMQRKQRREGDLTAATPMKRCGTTSTPFKTPGCSMSVRGMTLRSPAPNTFVVATPLKSRRQVLKSPHGKLVAVSGGSSSRRKSPYTRNVIHKHDETPIVRNVPVEDASVSTISYKAFERPLVDPVSGAGKRSTMNSSAAHKVLGSKVRPVFTNSGTKRRRRSSVARAGAQSGSGRAPAAAGRVKAMKLATKDIPFLY